MTHRAHRTPGAREQQQLFERQLSGPKSQGLGVIVILIFGFAALFYSGRSFAELSRREKFDTTDGIITSLGEPVPHRSGKRGTDISFDLDVEYSFHVATEPHTGTDLGSSPNRPSLDKPEVTRLQTAFAQKQPVTIRYNPAAPNENFLESPEMDSRRKSAAKIGVFIGSGLLLIGLLMIIKAIFW